MLFNYTMHVFHATITDFNIVFIKYLMVSVVVINLRY